MAFNPGVAEKSSPSDKLKKLGVRVLIGLVAFASVGGIIEHNQQKAANKFTAASSARAELQAKCFTFRDEDSAMRAGPVGSSLRQQAVDEFYKKVAGSPCIFWNDGVITTNPFEGITTSSYNFTLYQLAYYQSLRAWNGVEDFSTPVCADGWKSQSIGNSGACSHHGGVAQQFQSDIKYQLSSVVIRAGIQTIYSAGSVQKKDIVDFGRN
jgi:hypothetical protein